jgi:hypothetical protein
VRKRSKRVWEEVVEDDPGAGLLNLFDVWMVFAVSLLLALLSYFNLPELVTERSEVTIVKNPGEKNMEIIKKKGLKIEKYRVTSQELGGEGEKLGTAYRLKTGEVVYVPEDQARK